MSNKKKVFISLYIIAVVALLIVIYAVPSLTGALTKTELLQYGSLQVTDEATCFVVRDEAVFLAGESGTINYYMEQGTQVKGGSVILDIISSDYSVEQSEYAGIITALGAGAVQTTTYDTANNGIVSYYVDGYESYFTPETMTDIEYADVKDRNMEVFNVTRESTMKGEPLYKICKNNVWYVTCWVNSGNVSKYEVGKNVTLMFPLGEVKAKIMDIQKEGELWQIVFETTRYYEDFPSLRKVDATIITSDYSGIIIPNSSITSEEGNVGVYVRSRSGEYEFTPIKIITSDGTNSLAQDSYYYDAEGNKVNTVEVYDEILKSPN